MKSAVPPLLILRLLHDPGARKVVLPHSFPGDLGEKRNQLGDLTGAEGQEKLG